MDMAAEPILNVSSLSSQSSLFAHALYFSNFIRLKYNDLKKYLTTF